MRYEVTYTNPTDTPRQFTRKVTGAATIGVVVAPRSKVTRSYTSAKNKVALTVELSGTVILQKALE